MPGPMLGVERGKEGHQSRTLEGLSSRTLPGFRTRHGGRSRYNRVDVATHEAQSSFKRSLI